MLAIDASDSMTGAPEAAAVAAARTFVDKSGANQQIGLLTFNNGVTVLHTPTSDLTAVRETLAKPPQLNYGTHIFDGLNGALQQLAKEKISAGSIVLLSDGADVGSTTSLEKVIAAARAQHVRIFTVGLRSG